ncbi:Elongation factor 1-delta [Holothuria leucospilota]|uniref:Elongation factor 1-delta n=1 Tax=Holothuria leucospilota TaxID=206669 RepID=A0A9Q1HCA3_HOLLE|nr:Elongation factor 1-delta [Holothuria leucospilota]
MLENKMGSPLMLENIWFDKLQVEEAECKYYEHLANQHAGLTVQTASSSSSSLVNEIARARESIQSSLNAGVGLKVGVSVDSHAMAARLDALEKENSNLKKVTSNLQNLVSQLQARVSALEQTAGGKTPVTPLPKAPAASQKKGEDEIDEDDDDDDDLFGSDEELGDDTDMEEVKNTVKGITLDGLVWGASKLVDVAYGIKKLQIACVIEDDKVSVDDIEEKITAFEELVQSVDIVAFNKV